jgi:hypothetical protein
MPFDLPKNNFSLQNTRICSPGNIEMARRDEADNPEDEIKYEIKSDEEDEGDELRDNIAPTGQRTLGKSYTLNDLLRNHPQLGTLNLNEFLWNYLHLSMTPDSSVSDDMDYGVDNSVSGHESPTERQVTEVRFKLLLEFHHHPN